MGWYYPAKVGGVANIMFQMGRALAAQGHQVSAWATDYCDGTARIRPARQRVDGVDVIYFPGYFHGLQQRTYQTLSPSWLAAIGWGARRFDVVHLAESRALQVFAYGSLLRFGTRVPLVHSAFGALGEKPRALKYTLYDKLFLKPFLGRRCSCLLAQTRNEADAYARLLGPRASAKTEILPLGIDTAEARAFACRHAGFLRCRLGLGPEVPLVLYLGRLHPNKGVERLVRCFARAAEGTRAFLAIIGSDQGSRASIEAEAARCGLAGRCAVLDGIFGPERFGCYRDADLFAITSTYFEETSLASVEAAAVGTPCLVTPEAELPCLEEYGAGVMPASDDDAIAGALASLLREPARLRAMRDSALRLASERLDIQQVAAQLAGIYERIGG